MIEKRGGLSFKTGRIGRLNCLMQQLTLPGEKMNVNFNGKVRLESLRERDVMRINAGLYAFWTPLRWIWPEFTDYLREGPATAINPPTETDVDWSQYGAGAYDVAANNVMHEFWQTNILRVANEWFKWPEATDWSVADIVLADEGLPVVPLSAPWSRARFDASPDATADHTIDVSGSTMDVRDLAEVQAKFRSAMKRDVLSFNRYMELVNEAYGTSADPSREVDQVPLMIDQTQVGVNPREMPATDGASLGQWQSIFDFQVNHSIRGFTAPEHGVISFFLVVRFAPIIEAANPLAVNRLSWQELTGDPEYLSVAQPVGVEFRDLMLTGDASLIGYLPAGWQWRTGFDVIGRKIDERDSFPMMQTPTTQAECKDATRIKPAFTQQGLGDYLGDIYIDIQSRLPIASAIDSYMSGMNDDARPKVSGAGDTYPKGGKQL